MPHLSWALFYLWWRHQWKHFPRYWPFVRSPVNSPHKGQWRGALMFSLICAWINGWVNNGEADDLRRQRSHYDVTVMFESIDSIRPHMTVVHSLATCGTGSCFNKKTVFRSIWIVPIGCAYNRHFTQFGPLLLPNISQITIIEFGVWRSNNVITHKVQWQW